MKTCRMPARAALAGAAVTVLTAATLTSQPAGASAGNRAAVAPAVLSELAAVRLARSLDTQLRDAAAGSYYDTDARRLVVDVVDRGAEDTVRKAGAEPRRVRFSRARLDEAKRTLAARATIPGTAWATDPRANRVVVTADRTVTGAKLDRLNRVASRLGDVVVVRRTTTRLTRLIAGGDAIWGGGARCSIGFNVVKSGVPYFLTAGHCGRAVATWSAVKDGAPIATTTAYSFPGNDYALVKYTATLDHPSQVDLYGAGSQAITTAADPTVGEAVRRSGSSTGVRTGHVTGVDATVNYAEGTVGNLIKADVCAEPGDSGGPLFDGTKALGITSGGSGSCLLGGETYYQPVSEALKAYGVTLG
ncbi:S1 family peptidase [Streptomyces sp. NPDC049577]|uniref:S1 family peptidase n=1 Tax=Streptomyces sp. NPDC049577 TaxID=3155153 RepID=UPI003421FFBB